MKPQPLLLDSKGESLPPPNLTSPNNTVSKKNRIHVIVLSSILISFFLLFFSRSDFTVGFERPGEDVELSSLRGYYRQFLESDSEKWGNGNQNDLSQQQQRGRGRPSLEELQKVILKVPTTESAREISKSFTRETHIGGTKGDRTSAERVKNLWQELFGLEVSERGRDVFDAGTNENRDKLMGSRKRKCGHRRGGGRGGRWRWRKKIQRFFFSSFSPFSVWGQTHSQHHHRHSLEREEPRVWISTYYPYLNYPISSSLTLSNPSNSTILFNASLTETPYPEQDPTSTLGSPVFHGFSKNGTVRGELVYASRGTKQDFERLKREGIDLKGKIVLAQYGGSFRGLKLKAAQESGAVGCLIYSDPISDGDVTEENGYKPYPFGPAREPSSVQRGSVQFLSIRPGDPLTPFEPAYNPSLPNSPKRLPIDDKDVLNVPSIPSLPISYQDAIPLLRSLRGKGIKREDRDGWKEGGLDWKGIEYWTGPSGPDQIVELKNEMRDETTKEIWNTMAIIPGVLKDEILVIGNHNDAWTFGAGDPNSGTSSMYETAKAFSQLKKRGWKPFRTILLCSWDAEEYGLIGSTEFGEDFTDYLRERVVSYLNLDVSVSGSKFELAASPSLSDLLKQTTQLVKDDSSTPNTTIDNSTTDLKVKTLGSGSDFSVFLQYIGIASGNLGFTSTPTDPVYHYHSNYDSFSWMKNFGDPDWERHVFVSKVLGLTSLRLIESLVLPLNTTAYAVELEGYLKKVVELKSYPGKEQLDLTNLGSKLVRLVETSQSLDERAQELVSKLETSDSHSHHHHRGGGRKKEKQILKEIRKINEKKKRFESSLLVPQGEKGLKGREWYKSLAVAPGRWLGYGATTFPGLTEALELDKDVDLARREVERLEEAIERAIRLLQI